MAYKLPSYAFFDGRIVPYSEARVGVLTHALNYGTAAFAGLPVSLRSGPEGDLYIAVLPGRVLRISPRGP